MNWRRRCRKPKSARDNTHSVTKAVYYKLDGGAWLARRQFVYGGTYIGERYQGFAGISRIEEDAR